MAGLAVPIIQHIALVAAEAALLLLALLQIIRALVMEAVEPHHQFPAHP
jgi:hypothetical protein